MYQQASSPWARSFSGTALPMTDMILSVGMVTSANLDVQGKSPAPRGEIIMLDNGH